MSARRVWWLVAFALFLSATPSEAQRRRYFIESIGIDASVGSDGAVQVEEELTYRYRGDYTYAYRDIPRSKGMRIEQIAVSEQGAPFHRAEDGKTSGSFVVDERGDSTRITWYYTASNETRTFVLRYRVTGEVRRYADVAELYYKFVGDKWDRPIGRASVIVRFPASVTRDDLRAWAHGPLYGNVALGDGNVTMDVAPLPAKQFWEGRILFPSSAVPGLPVLDRQRLDAVVAEEAVWAEEANEARRRLVARQADNERTRVWRQALLLPFTATSFILAVAGLVVWGVSFARHGRPHDVQSRTAPGVAPSSHSPALVEYLLSRTVGVYALVATLLDLAQRGYLTVRETERTSSGLFREKKTTDYEFALTARPLSALQPFERDAIEFLLHQAGS